MVFFFCPLEDISLFTETSPLNNFSTGTAHIKAYQQGGVYRARRAVTRGFGFYGAIHIVPPQSCWLLWLARGTKNYSNLLVWGFFSIWNCLHSNVICAVKSLLFQKPFISTIKIMFDILKIRPHRVWYFEGKIYDHRIKRK